MVERRLVIAARENGHCAVDWRDVSVTCHRRHFVRDASRIVDAIDRGISRSEVGKNVRLTRRKPRRFFELCDRARRIDLNAGDAAHDAGRFVVRFQIERGVALFDSNVVFLGEIRDERRIRDDDRQMRVARQRLADPVLCFHVISAARVMKPEPLRRIRIARIELHGRAVRLLSRVPVPLVQLLHGAERAVCAGQGRIAVERFLCGALRRRKCFMRRPEVATAETDIRFRERGVRARETWVQRGCGGELLNGALKRGRVATVEKVHAMKVMLVSLRVMDDQLAPLCDRRVFDHPAQDLLLQPYL